MNQYSWVKDIEAMHAKFGVNEVVRTFDADKLRAFIDFRLRFIHEELSEAFAAAAQFHADDLVDAMIDIIVVALGTLNALDVDPDVAWDRVHAANMAKRVGIKESRPNPWGLPDLVKPPEWTPPFHGDNIGLLSKVV